eukprot:TRINITY_DN2218_c0_g3_i1.p1 TRINITY_DN2218_c0_g3~~TRINITY_DN2218_c0_g3_i1.p1  ORF type:complete len:172 (+),score=29.66 TRINITY_DN2218_c0_g3_i1:61-576(+)
MLAQNELDLLFDELDSQVESRCEQIQAQVNIASSHIMDVLTSHLERLPPNIRQMSVQDFLNHGGDIASIVFQDLQTNLEKCDVALPQPTNVVALSPSASNSSLHSAGGRSSVASTSSFSFSSSGSTSSLASQLAAASEDSQQGASLAEQRVLQPLALSAPPNSARQPNSLH